MNLTESLVVAGITLVVVSLAALVSVHRHAIAKDGVDQNRALRAAVEYRSLSTRCGLPDTKLPLSTLLNEISTKTGTIYNIDNVNEWFVQFGGTEGENDVISVWKEESGEKKLLSTTREPLDDLRPADRDFTNEVLARDCP